MPNSNTFEIKPIYNFVMSYVNKNQLWIDPFANTNRIANITNDINPEYKTDYNLDALEFLKIFKDNSVDGILFDPPYSTRQVSECYRSLDLTVNMETTQSIFWSNLKKEIQRIVKPMGKVLSFSWNSGGCGEMYGFVQKEILLVAHGGWHNDTICVCEIKETLF